MPLVLGLGETMVAFLVLLFLVETYPIWSRALSNLLGALPVVGGWASSHADQLTSAMYRAMAPVVSASFWPANAVFARIASGFSDLTTRAIGFGDATAGAIWSLARVQLPAVLRLALDAAAQEGLNAQQLARALYATATAYALQLAQQLGQELGAVQARADQELAALGSWAQAAIAEAEQQAQTAAQQLQADAIALLRGELAAAIASALGTAASWRDQLTRELEGVTGWAGTELERLRDDLGAGPSGLRTYTDAAIAAAVAALTLSLSRVTARVKAIEDSPCQQNCDTLGNLGGELSGLDLTLLLSAVAVMAKDPQAAATAILEGAGPALQEAGGTLAELVRAA